jgi:tetratricopeptide (TPR) repeat protein
VNSPRLFLSHVAGPLDWLIALEFGRVDDGQPPDHWRGVDESFGYLLDAPGGRVVGFKVLDFADFDSRLDPEVEAELDGPGAPRFDVPLLRLEDATAAAIIPRAREFFGGGDSINREFFERAAEAGADALLEQALYWWRACLQTGDQMAHFGIGYTLCDLGRHGEALPHLRYYTEIAPHHPWNWVWRGKAEQALGDLDGARRSYERAVSLTEAGGEETDAPELLAELDGPEAA